MPRTEARTIGAGGLGNVRIPHNLLGNRWRDCDKARVGDGEFVQPWPGHLRMGMDFLNTTLFGAASDKIDVMWASEEYVRKNKGHALVLLDRNSNTAGRMLGLGYGEMGKKGTTMVGIPVQTTGSGLDDISSRGVYSGSALSSTVQGIWAVKITTGGGGANQFDYSTDGGSTYTGSPVAMTGDWQTLANGVQVKFTATTGHTLNDVFTFTVGGRPMLAGSINRQGPHNYPEMTGLDGSPMIWTPWDRVKVDDIDGLRNAGISSPKIKPVAGARLSITDHPGSSDASEVWSSASSWVTHGDSSTTVTNRSASPDEANPDTNDYVHVKVPQSDRFGSRNLAYVDHGSPITIPATAKRLRFYIYGDFTRGHIRGKRLSIILATGAGLTGTTKELVIRNHIRGGKWIRVDLRLNLGGSSFSLKSIGLKMRRSIPSIGDLYHAGASTDGMDLYLDWFTIDEDENSTGTGVSETSDQLFDSPSGQGEWRFGFTWFRLKDHRESAMSPWSDPIDIDAAVNLDLSGYYPGIQAGLQNAAPDDADHVIVYAANASMGQDPRTGRGYAFRRLTDAIRISDLTDPGSLNQLIISLTDEDNIADFENIQLEQLYPFYNDIAQGGEMVIEDGDLILSGIQPNYSVGTVSVTNGSHVVTVDADAKFGEWMEGRAFWVQGDDRIYRVVKALDTDGDGEIEALWIATDFNPDTQDWDSSYQGTTNSSATWVLFGDDKRLNISNKHSAGIVDPESMSVLNFIKPMPGDSLVGGGKIGEFILAVGTQGAVMGRQNPSAFADVPYIVQDEQIVQAVPPYSNMIHLPGVTMLARRTWCMDADGGAFWIGQRGEIFKATQGNAIQRHPLSDHLAGVIDGWGLLTDTMSLRHSFMEYFRYGSEEYLVLCLAAAAKTPGVGVVSLFTDGYDFSAEAGGGSEDPVTSTTAYDFATFSDKWDAVEENGTGTDDAEAAPMVHLMELSPRPWSSRAWTDPWGNGLGYDNAATTIPWTKDTGQGSNVAVAFDATDPGSLAEESGENVNWPAPGSQDPHYHDYTFCVPSYGYYKFTINTSASNGRLAYSDAIFGLMDGSAVETMHHRFFPDTTEKILFWVYSDQSVASGKLKLRFKASNEVGIIQTSGISDFDVTINQALTANEWNLVELDITSSPPEWFNPTDQNSGNAYYKDIYGDEWRGFYYETLELHQVSALASNTVLHITGGRFVFDGDGYSQTGDEVDPYSSIQCIDYGASYNTDALGADFETAVLIDLKRNMIFTGSESRFTCKGKNLGVGCGVAGQREAQQFFGTRDGFIHSVFDETFLHWGAPGFRNIWGVNSSSPGGSTTVNVDQSFLGAAGQLDLPTDIDGNGLLENLLVAKVSAKNAAGRRLIEYRRVSSNTVSAITVSSAWDTNPVSTDTIVLAPLPFMWHSSEARGRLPISPIEYSADIDCEESKDTSDLITELEAHLSCAVYGASGKKNVSKIYNTPLTTKDAVKSDFEDGEGRAGFTPVSSKAVSYEFTGLGGQEGRMRVSNVKVYERTRGRETGR